MKKTSRGIMVTLLLSSILIVAFNIQAAVSLEPPETEWDRTYGGVGHDQARSIVQASDGGYIIAGRTESFGAGSGDAWLVKTDSFGNHEWDEPYGGTDNDNAHSLIQTADGGYAMAGSTKSSGAGAGDFWLLKTDQSGNLQWNKTYGGTKDDEVLWGLVQTGDEGYAMAGYTLSYGAGSGDFWLVKTDSNGNMQWNETYGGTGDDWAFSLIQTSDGGFAMTGWTASFGAGMRDAWLVKTNSTGHMEWSQTYGETGDDQGYSVTQTHDGGYAIAGHTTSFGATRYDWLLLRTDSSGNLLWSPIIYGGAYDDYAHFIQQTDDDGFLIVGDTQVSSVGGSFDGWLVKTDSTGQIQWDKAFGEADVRDGLNWVIETADGGYALAGEKGGPVIGGSGDFDFWLIKLAPFHEYYDLIAEYFPYWRFSKGEKWYPCSFYFDNDSDVMNNPDNYESEIGQWNISYVYIHAAEDERDITIEYWLYYAFNDHRPWGREPKLANIFDHEHDWDSTVSIIFDKSNLDEPRAVYFFHHEDSGFKAEPLLWDDVPSKDGNHVVAYVANGTHGAYPTEKMKWFDVWKGGGLEYGSEDFNWIIAEECAFEDGHDDCWVPHITIGIPQNEPNEGYWPHHYPSTYLNDADPAPWHRREWEKGMLSTLTLEIDPSIAGVGEAVTFSGQLIPQISTTVYLKYRREGTSDWRRWWKPLRTGSDGRFSESFRPPGGLGITEFVAEWSGNEEDPPALSPIATLTITTRR